jgi:hypothetical protein
MSQRLTSIPRIGLSPAAPTSRCLLQLSLSPGFVARNNISARRSKHLGMAPRACIFPKRKEGKRHLSLPGGAVDFGLPPSGSSTAPCCHQIAKLFRSGRPDLNRRHPAPKAGALPTALRPVSRRKRRKATDDSRKSAFATHERAGIVAAVCRARNRPLPTRLGQVHVPGRGPRDSRRVGGRWAVLHRLDRRAGGSVDRHCEVGRFQADTAVPDLEPGEDVHQAPSVLDIAARHGVLDEQVEIE